MKEARHPLAKKKKKKRLQYNSIYKTLKSANQSIKTDNRWLVAWEWRWVGKGGETGNNYKEVGGNFGG